MDGFSEAYTVVVSVMYRIEELHEDVAEDVELLETLLIYSQRLDKVAASTALLVVLVNLPGHPVVRWEIVVDAVDNVGEVREAQLVPLLAADSVAVFALEDVVVALGEGRKGGSTVRAHQAVGTWARAKASRDAVDLDVVKLDGPEELVLDRVPLDVAGEAVRVPPTEQYFRLLVRVVR